MVLYVEGQPPESNKDPVIEELRVQIGPTDSVSDLKASIAKLVGLPAERQYLCKIEPRCVFGAWSRG